MDIVTLFWKTAAKKRRLRTPHVPLFHASRTIPQYHNITIPQYPCININITISRMNFQERKTALERGTRGNYWKCSKVRGGLHHRAAAHLCRTADKYKRIQIQSNSCINTNTNLNQPAHLCLAQLTNTKEEKYRRIHKKIQIPSYTRLHSA